MSKTTIAIPGTGYVGLSNAMLLAQHNRVVAVDIVAAKVEMLNRGVSPIVDPEITEFLTSKALDFRATTEAQDWTVTWICERATGLSGFRRNHAPNWTVTTLDHRVGVSNDPHGTLHGQSHGWHLALAPAILRGLNHADDWLFTEFHLALSTFLPRLSGRHPLVPRDLPLRAAGVPVW